jgi:cyclophilin family peptidyl-prolyl cis-trans isomerase
VSPKSKVRKKPVRHKDPRALARQAAVEASRRSTRRRWSIPIIVLVVATVFGLFAVVGGDDAKTETPDTPEANCPAADGSSPRTTSFTEAPPICIDASKSYVAEMQTSKGTVTIALDAKAAPKTVNNFVVLARYHYFDTQSFHRIVKGFVVQGGSPDGSGGGGPGYKFEDEVPAAGAYKVGSVAMANSGPDTNGSQFFIVTGSVEVLQPLYSLFGEVTGGMDVVMAIDAVGTPASSPESGDPSEVVTIQTVTIKET